MARSAEQNGFATLWSGEHVVMVDEAVSRYPYADDGRIAVPAVGDWIDPMIGLSFAAAATTTIGIATGVLLLPEHNPLWSDDIASYSGEFVDFARIWLNPKSIRDRRIPVLIGGNNDAALRRVAQWGDGWYGFNLIDCDDVEAKLAVLHPFCAEAERDPAGLRLAVALREPKPADAPWLADAGVDELVLVASPPESPAEASGCVSDLAAGWAYKLQQPHDQFGRSEHRADDEEQQAPRVSCRAR